MIKPKLDTARWPVFALFIAAVIAYPLIFTSNYLVGAGILVGLMAVATAGFILLIGYARQLAVGQAAFCMVGGYGSALMTTSLHADPLLALVISAAAAMLAAGAIGLPILRLHGYVLAMASLCFQLILGFAATQAQAITGGAAGIYGIPKFSIVGLPFATDISYFYFVWAWVVVAVAVGVTIDRSAVGRVLRAIAASERAATSAGIDIARYKLQMFVLSAGLASITGSLTVHYLRIMAPDVFGFQYSLSMITAVVAGGLNAIAGGVAGAALVVGLREALRATHLPELEGIIMGALTVAVLIGFPRGVIGAVELLAQRQGRRVEPSPLPAAEEDAAAGAAYFGAESFAKAGLLVVDDVSRAFGSLQAVDGVSFSVAGGSITALIGANGAGKTTMFDIISGLQVCDRGAIRLGGARIEALQPDRIARLGMARTFQNLELFDTLTVVENVMAGAHRHTEAGVLATLARLPRVAAGELRSRQEAERRLAFVGMSAFRDHRPGELSFGQQRLIEIARALALRPALLLMDEPASGLNDTETEALAYLLLRIRAGGVTILLIEHDLRLVMGIADHVVVMNHGRKIAEGTPQAVRRDPDVVAAYIGTT